MKSKFIFGAIAIAAILIIAYILSSGASECKLCNDITLEARDLLMTGYSLKDVRKKIDDEYSGRGVGTNTSLPP